MLLTMKVIDLYGNSHEARKCTLEDIPKHFERVSDVVSKDEAKEYIGRMKQCVKEGTAYTLKDESCFFYYLKTDTTQAEGVSLKGTGHPLKTLALLTEVFRSVDKEILFLRFGLHKGRLTSEFKSLITISSIKNRRAPEDPLMVRVDNLLNKINKLTDRLKER